MDATKSGDVLVVLQLIVDVDKKGVRTGHAELGLRDAAHGEDARSAVVFLKAANKRQVV